MKQLGIIGGMGPLATADLYKKIIDLTPATCDQEHLHIVIDSFAQIEDRTKFIMGEGVSPLAKLVQSAKRLKEAGCEAMLMACNTAHFFAPDVEKEAGVKILHIAKVAVDAIKKRYPNAKDIAVIATSGTKKAGVYDNILKEYGLNSVGFSKEQQDGLMDCIYKGVKAGKTQEFVPKFNQIISEIKADVYIAACTEIPMFLPYLDGDYKFIDATLELAKVGVEFGIEREIF
ncbi:aspartate/glutamate racemase family protein [Campylobacter sp. RM9344]|uniref:Aspartate/glutamate racemase family protein n=1 Tax=Campylobacter californiensis TaxID=1032243 RepID=A0AAW3ZTM3_9BACT|nr:MULTISPECIES: amino acid racemase [unclassified Campylobacter]MBE2984699.1 aspartate/glutamate racemase family protein [Campylobacter sp. RM6883]MBE2994615.1 aspartate/glutamate racemase family protein [Campylobacter sp. RM6913]MBE3029141.1 aspartate/glutamate racemase family protein [Campylobacter sp. RM9344]MBE3608132.1 aspartate/glutamate racemase family protein [Campylobacter sp. RM9337]QCD50423.1 aspartate racemase [Campylobacter sp. RM6914]